MAFVQELLSRSSIPKEVRQAALDRVFEGPGIPDPHGTTSSFWLKQPHEELKSMLTQTLPETADVVIIGSGITAASVARTLLLNETVARLDLKIIMIEARDICSGATGRNGGHCLETAENYLSLKKSWGTEAAKELTKFRLKHLGRLEAVATAHDIVQESQFRKVQFLSAYFNRDSWAEAKASIKAFQSDLPEESVQWSIIEDAAEIRAYSMPEAVGIISGPAGALWPYKFVTSILADLKRFHDEQFSILDGTQVTQIRKEEEFYQVITSKGVISSKHVIHCTNGHAAHLLPEFLGRIYPVRGQMSAQSPPSGLPCQNHKHSWLFNYGTGFDYLTQLPVVDGLCAGEMMLGGGFVNSTSGGIQELGVSRDNKLDSNAGDHLTTILERVFHANGEAPYRLNAMWAGTMGFSADGLPWVGAIPEQLADADDDSTTCGRQWVAAGFSGEGMVNTWISGEAVAQGLIEYEKHGKSAHDCMFDTGIPKQMLITPTRMQLSTLSADLADELSNLPPAETDTPEGLIDLGARL